LTRIKPEALRVARVAGAAIPVHVKAGLGARVRAEGKPLRVGCAGRSQPVGEKAKGDPATVIVECRQKDDIGIQRRDHPDDGGDLRVFAPFDVADQKAGAGAVQTDIPGGDAQGFG
jgi:hypothetical protein